MINTPLLQKAVTVVITVHEVQQKQKRKGKDIPYIVHPLQVGLLLAQAGAREEVVAAGILHDVVEDSIDDHKVTVVDVEREFGEYVASLVAAVSEKNRGLSWYERKEAAVVEIESFSHDELLLKSGDIVSNVSELLIDIDREGDATFSRFNAGKEEIIAHTERVISLIIGLWPENPLAEDLRSCKNRLTSFSGVV